MDIESTLARLKQSKFRASFHLKSKDIEYIKEKGWETIKSHSLDFISKRLAPAIISNDGKQTPTHGHPVFPAQHACACCCRGCLQKWHKIEKNRQLTNNEINVIVDLILAWLHKEFDNYTSNSRNKLIKDKSNRKSNKPKQLSLFY
jgi:exodeoxyribonuclease V alpha subunit